VIAIKHFIQDVESVSNVVVIVLPKIIEGYCDWCDNFVIFKLVEMKKSKTCSKNLLTTYICPICSHPLYEMEKIIPRCELR